VDPAFATALVGIAGIAGAAWTAKGQRDVDRERIAGENDRHRESAVEEKRRLRRAAYARYIVALDVLDTYGSGYVPDDQTFERAVHELNASIGELELLAPQEVRDAIARVSAIHLQISQRMRHYAGLGPLDAPPLSVAHQHEGAYQEYRHELLPAVDLVKRAMRDDLQ